MSLGLSSDASDAATDDSRPAASASAASSPGSAAARTSGSGETGSGETVPSSAEASVDELRARVAELEACLARQARARAELVHLVSHELRTPIAVISGFSRLLLDARRAALDDEPRRWVEECLKACRRLDGLVGDLLAACPSSGTAFAVSPRRADLAETVHGLLESLGPMLEERGRTLQLDLGSLPPVVFDPGRIEQVLTNLLNNALRCGREGGTIRIAARPGPARPVAVRTGGGDAASWVVVSVEDDGPGIAPADRERLFEPYVRGEHGGDGAGLGIGLALCRRIVGAHGGRIGVEQGELGGARFEFTLPVDGPVAQEG